MLSAVHLYSAPPAREDVVARAPLNQIIQVLVLLVLTAPVWAAVQLTTSYDQGQVGNPFELIIEVSQSSSIIGAPELEPLQQDFKIHSNKSVYLTEKRAGRTVFISRWILSLSPKRAGDLIIPAINVKGESSQPLSFYAAAKPKPKAEPLILQAQLDTHDAYQGSPIRLNVKLYYSLALQSAELTQPRIDGVNIEPIGNQLSYIERLNQQRYQVIEQQYLLQALNPGRYQIPRLHFTGTDATGIAITSQSAPVEFEILPLPGKLSNQVQLTATEVRIEQHWQPSLDRLRAGDALTRTITVIAHGIPARWIPDISLPATEGISVYPQPPQLDQNILNNVLVSSKKTEFKLLLTQAGNHHLAELSLAWWDSLANRVRLSYLEPTDLQVLPFTADEKDSALEENQPPLLADERSSVAVSSREQTASAMQWQAWVWAGIALICAIGWSLSQQRSKRVETELTTLKQAALQPKPRTPPSIDPARQHNSFSELSEACETNNPERAYQCLFEWAAVHWPGMRVRTLEDIQELAKDPTLTYLLKNLQHQLQDPSDSWHGDLLIERIRRLRQQSRRPQRSRESIRVAVDD